MTYFWLFCYKAPYNFAFNWFENAEPESIKKTLKPTIDVGGLSVCKN